VLINILNLYFIALYEFLILTWVFGWLGSHPKTQVKTLYATGGKDLNLKGNPTLSLFLCDVIFAAGGHVVLRSCCPTCDHDRRSAAESGEHSLAFRMQ